MTSNITNTPPRLPPYPLEQTFTTAVMGFATLFSLSKPVCATDLSVYLRMGDWMSREGRLLEQEPFVLSALGQTFQNGTWGAQWLFHALFSLGGYPALQVMLAVLMLATLKLVQLTLRPFGQPRLEGLGVLFAFLYLLQNLGIRPQSFSITLFAAVYYLLLVHPLKRFTPPLLLGLMGLWSNLHGAFPVALAIPGILFLQTVLQSRSPLPGDQAAASAAEHALPSPAAPPSRWVLLGVVMGVGTFLSPYGPSIYRYILENSTMPATRGLDEWLPPSPFSFLGGRFYLGLVLTGLLAIKLRRQVRLWQLLAWGLFAVLAIKSQRMIVWWGIVTTPVLVSWLNAYLRPPAPEPASRLHTRMGYAMLLFWAFLTAASWPTLKQPQIDERGDYHNLEDDTPVKVATWLLDSAQLTATRPSAQGRMFCRFEWGSYFLDRLYPAYQPWIDIRLWMYPDPLWNRYLAASRGENGWEALMDEYRIDTLVLSPQTQQGLIDAASNHASWNEVYHDDQAVVFRRGGQSEAM